MELKQFMSEVESSEDLVGVGMVAHENKNGDTKKAKGISHMVVKHDPTSLEVKVPVDAIGKSDWKTLYDVMTGKREPAVLQHMTRVVGYYSKIENWNPSKIGELKNRQEGNYEVIDD